MNLADKAEGRIIHLSIDITLIPPQNGEPGDTDAALDIGRELIQRSYMQLQLDAHREGFVVEMEARTVVY